MVWGHHVQFRSGPPLFCNFQQFSVMVAAAHYPIIQKEMRWMSCFLREWLNHLLVVLVFILACLWFLSVLVCLWPFLTLSSLIVICLYLLLRSLLSDICSSLFSMVIMVFIYLQDAYIHIPIVKHHHHFLQFVWQNMPYQWKVLPFGLATASRVFTALTKPILFLCHHKGFCIVIYYCLSNEILVLVHSKWAGKRAHILLCSLLVCCGLHINFSMSDLHLIQTFCFLGLCWHTVCMSVALPPDKLADI